MFKEISLSSSSEKRGSTRGLILGVGINDAPYKTAYKTNNRVYICPYYTRWCFMLNRCYSPNWIKNHPTYKNCYVTPTWHSFMAFKDWMILQDWKGKQLDKDLLSLSDKRYSPETCLFISAQLNSLFNKRDNHQGTEPLGIYKRKGKYEVGISYGNSKRVWVGAYTNIPDAIDAYLAAKLVAMNIVLKNEPNPVIKRAVKNYYKYFADIQLSLKTAY